jgi:hypothetical protein
MKINFFDTKVLLLFDMTKYFSKKMRFFLHFVPI